MSDSLWPHELQHAWFPCPSLSSGVCSRSCPLNWWCSLTISSSVALFSSCPQSFPASGSIPVSWLFISGGQSIGTSASILPMSVQNWFPLGLTGLISLQSKGLSRVCVCELLSHVWLCDSIDCSQPVSSVHGILPGKNTGVCSHSLLQGIFPTQGSNPGLLHCGQIFFFPSEPSEKLE